jgi:hypothetical protein
VSRAAIFIWASIASTSTAAMRLNPDMRLPERDILLLMVVFDVVRLNVEDGDADLGVDSSELEFE